MVPGKGGRAAIAIKKREVKGIHLTQRETVKPTQTYRLLPGFFFLAFPRLQT